MHMHTISDQSMHGFTHRSAPSHWHEGFPLGNGVLGAMCWGDGEPLAFTLDHANLWDLRIDKAFMDDPRFNYASLRQLVAEERFDEVREIFETRETCDNPVGPTKISIGRLEVALGAAVTYECRLDLEQATISGTLQAADGTAHALTAFVHRRRNLLCLRVAGLPDGDVVRLVPLAAMNDGLANLGCPAPRVRDEGGRQVLLQHIPEGGCYAVAWVRAGDDLYLAVETGTDEDSACRAAVCAVDEAVASGFAALHTEHCEAWREFWEQSAVYLPDSTSEFLWYYGLYLLASSARQGHCPPGLQGLWAMDGVMPPWRGDYHADCNVQETFWPGGATGHLELLDSWCDHMHACLPQARAFTLRFFGTAGTFWPACTIPEFTSVPSWHTVQYGWSHTGWLGWLVWLRWRYSCDTRWLAETGYPILAEIFRFYQANVVYEEDGCWHVPLSSSPEYAENTARAWGKDPNIDLALIRRCCDWLVEMEAALGIVELTEGAQALRAHLAPYAVTADHVLCLWPGKPLDESHRHPSQLMAIHPAMDLTIDGDAETQAIIRASVEQYLALGQWRWAGHTYAQLISFAAVLGRAGWAFECLRQFTDHWIGRNGLHFNADMQQSGMSHFSQQMYGSTPPPFTMEANCAVTAGICDMLVQGWGDTLRLFPAVPAHWRDVAFRDLVAEGAWRVSAVRRDGLTVWVRISATVTRPLRLRDPFAGAPCHIDGAELYWDGDEYTGILAAGQAVTLCCDADHSWDETIATIRAHPQERLGLW